MGVGWRTYGHKCLHCRDLLLSETGGLVPPTKRVNEEGPSRESTTGLEKLDLVAEELILSDQPGSYSQSDGEERYQGHQE